MLNIKDINFSYGNNTILNKIDCYIKKKEFVGIIGPNGSGKSTLLKNISNYFKPESGMIYLNKKILNEYSAKELAKYMAVVPQETMVQFNFTVYDLVMMGRNPYQDRWGRIKSEDREIVQRAMNLTDTTQFKDKNIDELSGGERQRVIIARALAQQPDILLLDEPTASLDINYQIEIFDLLSYLNKKLNITILVVSHDLNLSSQYCERLILLNQGEIYIAGSPAEVLTKENVKSVYKTEVIIKENPLTDTPYITLIPRNFKKKNKKMNMKKIHVICGGGSARELLDKLYYQGYSLSCGVLNQGDRDWELAKQLDLKQVEIPPFTYIQEKDIENNVELLRDADLIIIADTPFGHGNVDNLKMLSNLVNRKKIILHIKRDFEERDYTGGEASIFWEKIKKENEIFEFESIKGILNKVQDVFDNN